MRIRIPTHLSDAELKAALKSLAADAREKTAQLVAHLVEMDSRRLYLEDGFSSLFTYCTTVLRLSEVAAYNRIEAARLARRSPEILNKLADGTLNLATLRLVGPHLTAETKDALLAAASGKSKREVEELVARHAPRPDVPESIRRLPAPPPMTIAASTATTAALSEPALALPAPLRPAPRPVLAPLAPDRYEIRFTASAVTYEKLRLAQDLLRHANPSGDIAEIFDRALTLLVADLEKKKFAATERPRASRSVAPGSRDVPAKVQRAVARRDRGRCAFVGTGGRRCNERAFLEFHHVHPHGVGGEPTIGNIELRCRAHNGYEAAVFYGQAKIDPYRARSAADSSSRQTLCEP